MFKSVPIAGMLVFCCCLMVWPVPAQSENAQFNTKEERIGSLHLEMAAKDLSRAISCKPQKGKEILEGATGEYVQDWKYPKCGITLKMSSASKAGPKTVADITIEAPSDLKTSKGIHIGSTESEVIKAYGSYRDPEGSVAGEKFVAGSVYDGLIFTFKNGKVAAIFLGAAAE